MADSFSRDSLAAYEKGPQRAVPNTTNPFKGATPAAVGDPGSVDPNARSQILDIAPGGAPVGARGAQTANVDDAPIVDEDGTLGDPTDSGEGTSDDLTSDSSTDIVDSGDAAETTEDLTADNAVEDVEEEQAPKKGSAQERIVELNDKLEGAMEFGKAMQALAKAQLAENARLAAERSGTAATATAAPPVVEDEAPGPMPDMTDDDVQFDNDKFRVKMQKWSSKNSRYEAKKVLQEMAGVTQANAVMRDVDAKAKAYMAANPESNFLEVVTNNPVLAANKLAPDAGLLVARSPYTAELLMRFGSDPAFAIRAAQMHPVEQIKLIGKLEEQIEQASKVKTKTTTAPTRQTTQPNRTGAQPGARKSVSQAPPPPRVTPSGRGNTTFNPLDPNVSMDDVVNDHRRSKQAARAENRRQRGLS